MPRSLLTAVLISATALAFIAATFHADAQPQQPENRWYLMDPITYENISIFPVVSASMNDTSAFLTLDEGLSSGEVLITEQGAAGMARTREGQPVLVPEYTTGASVNSLVLINRSKRPLLLLAGELVSGGKQDRIIGKDRLVPAGAPPLPLDVFCVEHGRWSSGSKFADAKTIVHPSVRERAAVNQDQNGVWEAVRSGSTSQTVTVESRVAAPQLDSAVIAGTIASEAPTQSYDKIYERGRTGASVDELVEQLQKRFEKTTGTLPCLHGCERVVGVVVAYGGEVAWSDIFASSQLFDRYWSKLLRSYAVEALARPTLREVATKNDAGEFLRRPDGREIQETQPGVYRWREITEGKLSLIELDALQPKPITLHRLLLRRTS